MICPLGVGWELGSTWEDQRQPRTKPDFLIVDGKTRRLKTLTNPASNRRMIRTRKQNHREDHVRPASVPKSGNSTAMNSLASWKQQGYDIRENTGWF